jgi:hypothetical protein
MCVIVVATNNITWTEFTSMIKPSDKVKENYDSHGTEY